MKRSDGLPGGTSRYAHALTFTVLGQLVLGATRLIVLACLGRVEGRAVLGETVALLALGTFLVLLGPQAIGAAASRYISMASSSFDTHRQASVEALTSKTALISFLPLGLVAVSAARVALGAGWIESLWAGVLPACLGAASYARAVRYGRLRFAQGFVWDCLGAASTLAAMAAVLIADAPAHALLPLCLGYLVSAVAGWPRSRFAVPLQSADAKEVLRYAAWTAVQVVAAGGLLQAVTWLAALRTGPLELGALGAAVSIATPMLLLSIALRTSLTPFLARDVSTGDLQPLNDSIDLLQRGMSAIFIPTFGIACIWAPVLLRLIFGEQYADASDLLVILLLAVSVNCLNASHVWQGPLPARHVKRSGS